MWAETVRQRRAIVVNDYPAPNPLKKGYPEGHAPLSRFLAVPVFSDGRIVAVTAVANKPSDYTPQDVHQLTLMMDAVWKMAERKRAEAALAEAKAGGGSRQPGQERVPGQHQPRVADPLARRPGHDRTGAAGQAVRPRCRRICGWRTTPPMCC